MKDNLRREKFIKTYLENGGNAAAAAIEAGYSKKCSREAGYRLLHTPEIKQIITAMKKKKERQNNPYTIDLALDELERCIDFAHQVGDAKAMLLALELKLNLMKSETERNDHGKEE